MIGTSVMKELTTLKVACRVQVWKISGKFGYSVIKNDIMFMYLLCIYKKTIILSLFQIGTFLKTYVIRLHNLISINIFYTIKNHSFSL